MVVLEAWAYAKPVLMTPQCNLPEGFSADAAIRIEPNSESIARGLAELFELSDAQRRAMGLNGRELVAQRFTWPRIAREMRSVHDWILGRGPKPGCVVTT
jgi:poly(glycerol-phosphate) alpha-glucosyltransferase